MHSRRYFLTLALALISLPSLRAQQNSVPAVPGLPPAARSAANSIDAERIRAHVRFLSLDLLEGRGPGTRGDQLAAEYIATQYALSGLQPAGDGGRYFQRVPLMAVHTVEDKTKFSFAPQNGQAIDLAYGTDIVSKDQTGQAAAEIDAPIVFVGYGIVSPEYKWNDYAGVDMHGKIALVIVNEPPSTDEKFFKGKALTYYGRWTYKYEQAARLGAAGVLIIHRTDLASYGWDVVRNSQAIEKSYLQGDPDATLRAAAWIQHDVAQKLLTAAGLGNVDDEIAKAGKPGFKAVELPVRLKGHVESRVRKYDSTNVVGKVAGAAPSGNAVLYSAHYDHLGIDPDAKGDNIYNGAADNGTGCGILLEMARAVAQSTQKPPHDIYIAAVTAEEQGLLGSQYLGMHPPVPAKDITLDLNYDMILPIGVPRSADLGGADRIDFYPTVQAVAKAFDIQLLPDPNPMAGHYYRSDHFSLARVGIPAFSVDEGELFEGHDEAWGQAQFKDFVANHYHQPSDEYRADWDFRGNAKLARFGLVLGWLASEQPHSVEWNAGDEFEAARKKSEAGK
ncbi:M28 family peptidase [Occallatibacter riparius]|uniref:M28 family peptidase n=1 Tax=Occallatibacter riparius TaxID=1002689 RepID=A0A9J7BSP9_9BACT|nr:M28 family peptidase [Occallatibacter riparius]UWZ85609.1 M28 family peptidase [Occallatibacter riparius]